MIIEFNLGENHTFIINNKWSQTTWLYLHSTSKDLIKIK